MAQTLGLAGLVVRLIRHRLGFGWFGWFGSLYFGLVNCFDSAAVLYFGLVTAQ